MPDRSTRSPDFVQRPGEPGHALAALCHAQSEVPVLFRLAATFVDLAIIFAIAFVLFGLIRWTFFS